MHLVSRNPQNLYVFASLKTKINVCSVIVNFIISYDIILTIEIKKAIIILN